MSRPSRNYETLRIVAAGEAEPISAGRALLHTFAAIRIIDLQQKRVLKKSVS